MKTITNEQTLWTVSVTLQSTGSVGHDVQTNNAKCNNDMHVEEVRNPERKAQKYAQHSSPSKQVSMCHTGFLVQFPAVADVKEGSVDG
jgi:hypothetical protein